jgi:hypothetical protein
VVGGILAVAGLPEFLTNQDEAAVDVDQDLQELIALAEHVVGKGKKDLYADGPVDPTNFGKAAKEWLPTLREARLLQKQQHESASDHAQAIAAGKFFGSRLDKPVPITVGNKAGTATLRVQPTRSRQKRFWLQVVWDAPGEDGTPQIQTPPDTAGEQSTTAEAATQAATEISPTQPADVPTGNSAGEGNGNGLDWG